MKSMILTLFVGTISILLVVIAKPRDDTTNQPVASNDSIAVLSETNESTNSASYANRGLTTLPSEVLKDTSLTRLDISNNQLTGSLPAEIRFLSRLETIDASNNAMTGVPAEIGQLSQLRLIDLSNNQLSRLPLEFGNLAQLEILDLRGNSNISTYDIELIQTAIPQAEILY